MNDTHDEVVSRLKRLGALTPTPEATSLALDRVRSALAASPVPDPPSRWRLVRNRWAGIAAMALVAAGLSAWLLLPASSGRAWADVQAAINKVHSITYRWTLRIKGQSEQTSRDMLLDNGLCRVEDANGNYTVADFAKARQLHVDQRNRTVTNFQGMNNMPPADMYQFIKNLPGDSTARPLPGKKIDGREVLGFTVKVKDQEWTVWADARTRLPVRVEFEATDDKGKIIGDVSYDEFVFDKGLDLKLFSFDPPAGYKLQTFGIAGLPSAPNDPQLLKPTVTPLVGIGPVKFGTSVADVERLLGKADSVKEVSKNGYTEISYWSRGYFFGAGKTAGVVTVSCSAQAALATKTRDFAGKTDKGIAMGARGADIIRAYGEPDSKNSGEWATHMKYNRLQCDFTLHGDRLVMMNFNRPRPAK